MPLHVQNDDVAPVVVVSSRLRPEDHGRGQEAALVADLDDVGPHGGVVDHTASATILGPHGKGRVRGNGAVLRRQESRSSGRVHGRSLNHLYFGLGEGIRSVEGEAEGAVIGRVQHAEAVGLGLDRDGGIRRAVDHRGVHERLRRQGGVGRAGVGQPTIAIKRIAGTRDGAVSLGDGIDGSDVGGGHRQRGPEPRTVVPPAHGIGARQIVRILVGHVDMRKPEIAFLAPVDEVPGGILPDEAGGLIGHEGLILEDKGNAIGIDRVAVEE